MKYKLEFNEDSPTSTFVRILSGDFEGVLIQIADIKVLVTEGEESNPIQDFVYRVQEDGVSVDETNIPNLTNRVSEILCDLMETEMVV